MDQKTRYYDLDAVIKMDPQTTQPLVVTQTPPVTQGTVILGENPPLYKQSLQNDSPEPFYKEWTFWILVILVLVLAGVTYFFVTPLFYKALETVPETNGEVIRLHVVRLVAPVNGFLVLQKDENGLPGLIFELSSYIISGTYSDFYILFNVDQTSTHEYYSNLVTDGKFYVSFYTDNGDGVYTKELDTVLPNDIFGRKLRAIIVKGKAM